MAMWPRRSVRAALGARRLPPRGKRGPEAVKYLSCAMRMGADCGSARDAVRPRRPAVSGGSFCRGGRARAVASK
eukprot:4480827-Prymnesium_polylepis.1